MYCDFVSLVCQNMCIWKNGEFVQKHSNPMQIHRPNSEAKMIQQ